MGGKSEKTDRRLWLIGGTQESTHLAVALADANFPCTVTVTTEAARMLYPPLPTLQVWVGRLCSTQIDSFLQEQGIVAILDASHPYAVEISKLAIAEAIKLQIPYLRYERPSSELPHLASSRSPAIELDCLDALLAGNYLQGQRVLLTLGYRSLPLFLSWQDKCTLFARLLPSITALEAAYSAGFTPNRIIALRPPISADLEKALWRHWQISLVVTKASGSAGGEDVKRLVAAELGVPLVVITRPNVVYPQQTSDLSTALEFCRRIVLGGG